MDLDDFQVDEDEGSSSQDEAKPARVSAGENRQISGSPSGVPHPSFFPSKEHHVYNACE
jgi:hypothetical protein